MTDLILREFKGKTIRQREDGYVCLTDMATATGKLYKDWYKLQSTQQLIAVISHKEEISPDILITSKQYHGTYGHPKVAIAFATWCSAEFFCTVIDWTEEILVKGYVIARNDDETLARLRGEVDRLESENLLLAGGQCYEKAVQIFVCNYLHYKKGKHVFGSALVAKFQEEFWSSLPAEFQKLPCPDGGQILQLVDSQLKSLPGFRRPYISKDNGFGDVEDAILNDSVSVHSPKDILNVLKRSPNFGE